MIWTKHKDLSLVIASCLLGLFFVWAFFAHQNTEFDKLGLGIGTDSVYQNYKDRYVHCVDLPDAEKCIADTNKKNVDARIILLGWSQLHGVNQYRQGQRTASWLLADAYTPKNIDFLTFSQGNANPQEHYVLYHWLASQTQIKGLVIGAWIQGMREEGIRSSVAIAAQNPDVRTALIQTDTGLRALSMIDASDTLQTQDDNSVQKKVEAQIVTTLKEHTALWRAREEAQGHIRIFFRNIRYHIIQLRDFLLGLERAHWTWPIPEARYQKNIEFIEALINHARDNNIEVLVYIPPKPSDIRFPFDPDVYNQFKEDVKNFADKHGAHYANLEDCVKGPVWGMTKEVGGKLVRDMTHFTSGGHAQLAQCLETQINQHFRIAR